MEDCNRVAMPMESGIQLQHTQDSDEQDPEDRQLLYQSLIGSLMYLMTIPRPDLAFTISMLSKLNAAPTDERVSAAKQLLSRP
jgi:hypothetical protein